MSKIQSQPNSLVNLANPADTAFLFIDHQAGFLQTITHISLAELRKNVSTLAKLAHTIQAPAIVTGIDPSGASGPVMPEILREAPKAIFIERDFEINVWDNEAFVKAVKATGKRTLVISGIWTSVCATFPALSALDDGYTVYAVADACGDITLQAHEAAVLRWQQAGIIPVSVNSIAAEMQQTWNRKDAGTFRDMYAGISPHYQALIESLEGVTADKSCF
ncbi:nicotinamidase-related amidase [Filimonas zeae]|uniref:Hydrolase n=1 Tax=Filimonas zeae TaxID=1737353 RepID=A0A917IZT5_9BACT|nr:isochorismatase family protein [Filimonas zeae]MDR6340367.1 nicotinamidase-related amidase [Filimonas zeae]GGH72410.1 hydrolase [Filimonas zeae]